MASTAPLSSKTLELGIGGLPLVQANGLNTNKAVNFSGFTIDTSGNFNGNKAVIDGNASTLTLTAAQSGSIVLFDRAAGVVVTLPACAAGLFFDFVVVTTITSNAAKVITSATGSEFIAGGLAMGEAAGTTTLNALGNGSTHVAISMNGTTTGGVLGGQFRLTAVTATLWQATGVVNGSGTLATPFATS